MTGTDKTLQALRTEVSELKLRVKELSEENRALRDICDENDIQYKEFLAARQKEANSLLPAGAVRILNDEESRQL